MKYFKLNTILSLKLLIISFAKMSQSTIIKFVAINT